MTSISNPWTFCKNLSTLIVSCTLLIRVLSIGYVIGGFVIMFKDPQMYYLSPPLKQCKLGIFPLGSFISALIFFLIPAVIVNALNSLITYLGICKRRNHYLQISTMISLLNLIWILVLIGLWSWLINETYNDIKECFALKWKQHKYKWDQEMVNVLRCCGVDGPTRPPDSTPSSTECPFSVGCFDVFSNKIHTYGSTYIAALVVNCITEIVMIVGTSYLHGFYKILKARSEKSIDSKELHKFRNGAIVSMCLSLKENWTRNKLSSIFGYMSVFSLVIDVAVISAIFLSRFKYPDITIAEFHKVSGPNNMNMGIIKDISLVLTIFVMMWSILGKALSLGGMRSTKRWLFVLYIVFEIIAMLVECIILIFGGLLLRALYCCFWKDSSECSEYTYSTTTVSMISYKFVCDSWNNSALFLWTSTGILIFHIVLKVVVFVLSVKILRRFNRTRVGIDEENKSISKEKNPQPSFEVKHSKILTKRMGKNTGSESINKTESVALESENNVPSNITTKEKLNKQPHKLNSEKNKKLNKRQHELTSEKKKKKKKRKKKKNSKRINGRKIQQLYH